MNVSTVTVFHVSDPSNEQHFVCLKPEQNLFESLKINQLTVLLGPNFLTYAPRTFAT